MFLDPQNLDSCCFWSPKFKLSFFSSSILKNAFLILPESWLIFAALDTQFVAGFLLHEGLKRVFFEIVGLKK